MGFAIICDARSGERIGIETLALVDRRLTRRQWWTSDDVGLILNYRNRAAAEFAASRLRRNKARVVPIEHALALIGEQARELDHYEVMSGVEDGWDGHKCWIGG